MFQDGRVVTANTGGENVRFPGRGRQFEPLELADDLRQPGSSMQLCAGMHMLPAYQKTHEISRRDRLDFTP